MKVQGETTLESSIEDRRIRPRVCIMVMVRGTGMGGKVDHKYYGRQGACVTWEGGGRSAGYDMA